MSRPPVPPFTLEAAIQNLRQAEKAWNSRDPSCGALTHPPGNRSRNRCNFVGGRVAIEGFLTWKRQRELDDRRIEQSWVLGEDRIAVRFGYECHDSAHHLPINEAECQCHWSLGQRPHDPAGLTERGL